MKQIILDYQHLKSNMAFLIDKSGYKIEYIAEKAGIKKPHFYTKKKRGAWTDEEMGKILDIIENEEIEDLYLAKLIEETKKEETVSLDELRDVLRS